ncbi:MAG: aspartate aminotransferase family protein [Bacteroidales bacterium]|nr:aspartate aminotransferase family protein [Bacteroidales bacterium]MBP5518193.1 aspartate aminotransferase family protein [Bacteroidales bacterium]
MEDRSYTLRDLFFRHVGQTSSSPLGLSIVKAEGVFFYSESRRYLDFISGVCVSNVGHARREVVEAVKQQMENYAHLMVYGEMIESPQVLHARLLTSILPSSLDCVYYVNSGSEANEAAVKLAKRITGRRKIVSCRNAYHGSTQGNLSLMSSEEFKGAFRPLMPMVEHIVFNDVDSLSVIDEHTAAVIIEPVQGEGGVQIPKDGFLASLRKKCDSVGALLIFDEVQTGFGRTGKMFAFEKYGVVPDILTLAKALGGGMPLGAMVTSSERMKCWQTDPPLGHITTFGGHPVCCAAALASLKLLLEKDWVGEVERKSKKIYDALISHPAVKEIRAAGLLIAVDLGDAEKAKKVLYLLLDEGVLTDWFLFQPTSFRIAPPLCITDQEIDLGIEAVRRALDKL